ncbi:hypothetical protein TNCV_575291 [Trichonephila clavipes]|nr:hypothetical protein TNCV_575291 [Trichonephila clavipes]
MKEDIETEPTLNEMFEKATVSPEELVAVNADNVCAAPIMAKIFLTELRSGTEPKADRYFGRNENRN